MSAEMRDFAAAFNRGLEKGQDNYNKEQERAIQREHNKLLRDQHEAQDRIQQRRTDLYAESVKNAGVLSAARAQAALNKGAGKGGGGTAAPAPNPDKYAEGAAGVGLAIPKPQAPPAPTIINQTYQSTSDDADPGPIAPPGDYKRGGKVRKFADGGMTVQEALNYGPKSPGSTGKAPETAASSFGSSYDKAAASAGKKQDVPKPKITEDPRVGPSLKIAEADVGNINQAISTDYRRGGVVRRFEGGGSADLSDPQAAVKSMAYTPADKNPDGSKKTEDQGPIAQTARAVASGSAVDWSSIGGAGGSAGGATGSGGDSTGGVSGTGGVGGSASDDAGGSAAAGVGGDDGGTYRRGGRVRRFQSGGRVMEAAIDTGTSGPGSGYGYRAAPPARRY
jgi:hypothetical protein